MMLRKIDFRRSWQLAREAYSSVVAERDHYRWELAQARRERDELRDRLIELSNAVHARQQAEEQVRVLYRERGIARARAAERDPMVPLN